MTSVHRRAGLGLVTVIGLILWFGLNPFDFARINNVQWLDPGPGLRFGDSGLAVSEQAFTWPSDADPAAVTVEMWVRASRVPYAMRAGITHHVAITSHDGEPRIYAGRIGADLYPAG